MMIFPRLSGAQSAREAVPFAVTQETSLPADAIVIRQAYGDSLLAPVVFRPDERVDLIVEFTDPALARVRAASSGKMDALASAAAAISRQHDRFREDLLSMETRASKSGGLGATRFGHSYSVVFNGMALTTTRGMMPRIAALDYVAAVHEDVIVRKTDESSNRVIRADEARTVLGATGEGIRVAVIDTGVDYTHPALGGGIGPEFKVIGGYDFVDDDTDPMDGNGHGTHVAGIVAGDDGSEFLGVAPAASLLAYRVLNDDGLGPVSGVIAAIEHALDPDGNPATDDGAHVINLSLGGSGNPDDAGSVAVDNATIAGAVCVVAAGNEGRAYSIGSPGASRLAVTVGATDNFDALATFSSRGPASITFENKPDVMAPGVAIRSSLPGGAYAAINGTSMATPHVAGAAALLLQRHSGWSPADVKSALMLSAIDLGLNVWQQGAGRIDIMRADAVPVSVAPSSISFGNLDPAQSSVTLTRTLTLRNLGSSSQTWSFAPEHALSGVAITLSQSSLTLAAGASGSVTVTGRFEPSQIAFPGDIEVPYAGAIRISGGGDVRRIPFTVTKTPQLTLRFDEAPFYVTVLSDQGGVEGTSNPPSVVSYPLRAGRYDLVMQYAVSQGEDFSVGYLIREQVSVTGKHELVIPRSDLRHTVTLEPVDRGGQALGMDYGYLIVERKQTSTVNAFSMSGPLQTLRIPFSDVSSRFKLDASIHNLTHESGDDYVVPLSLTGVAASTTLRNEASDFRTVRSRFSVPSDVTEVFVVPQIYANMGPIFSSYGFYRQDLAAAHRFVAPFVRTVHYGARPYADFGYRYNGQSVYNTTGGVLPDSGENSAEMMFLSSIIEATASEVSSYIIRDLSAPFRVSSDAIFEEHFGGAPVWWAGRTWNIGSISMVRFDQARRLGLFVGGDGEIIGGHVRHHLSRDDEVVARGDVPNGSFIGQVFAPADAYQYDLSFDGGYVDEWPVRADVRLNFDTRFVDGLYDPDPPLMAGIELISNGTIADALDPSEEGSIVARVQDTYNAGGPVLRAVGPVRMHARRLGETQWDELAVAVAGDRMTAAWPSAWATGYYDLRIEAEDLSGGRFDYRVAPALRYGAVADNTPPVPPSDLMPASNTVIEPDTLQGPLRFSWQPSSDDDEGQLLRYVFRLWGENVDTTMATSEPHLDVAVADLLTRDQAYQWTVHATDGFVKVGPSEPNRLLFGTAVSADRTSRELPAEPLLTPAYPNPFTSSTHLEFVLPQAGKVVLEVYDLLGRRVALIVDDVVAAGSHTHRWTPGDLPSGMYMARLRTDGHVASQRLVFVR
ncbi:MAG: S8 family serine peptidase [Bacteroidota bacterium]